MARGYEEDLRASFERQNEIQKRAVLLEIIRIACENETYEDFRKALYAIALSWMQEAEDQGLVKENTTEQAKANAADDGILL